MKVRILHIFIAILFILVIFSQECTAETLNVQGTLINDPLTTNVVDSTIGNQIEEWGENGTGQTIDNSGTTSSHDLGVGSTILNAIGTVIRMDNSNHTIYN